MTVTGGLATAMAATLGPTHQPRSGAVIRVRVCSGRTPAPHSSQEPGTPLPSLIPKSGAVRDPCLSQGRREHVSSAPRSTQARPCGPDARGGLAWKSCWVQGPLPTRVPWEATQAGPSLPRRGCSAQICAACARGSAVHTAQPRVGSCAWPPSHRPFAHQAQETMMLAALSSGLGRLV